MFRDSMINRHKTKALGAITVALGFLQSDPSLRSLLPDAAYGWAMLAIGLGVTVCGFLNSFVPVGQDDQGTTKGGGQVGHARPTLLALILAISSILIAIPGCAQLGLQTSGTFNDRLAGGYSLVTAISGGAGILLDVRVREAQEEPDPERRGAMLASAKADAQNIKDQAQQAKDALDVARGLRGINFEAAEERLVSTLRILEALQRYLEDAT